MELKQIEDYINAYLNAFIPYKSGAWCYEDGIVLSGVWYLYQTTRHKNYIEFIDQYLNRAVSEDGKLSGYKPEDYNIDNINSGKVLFDFYKRTGQQKYRIALELLFSQIESQPRTNCGNFWHKKIYPHQIWLDGLYMAQPFYARYLKEFMHTDNFEDIINQFKNIRNFIFDESKRLYYHAYDESREMPWANKKTGCSPNVWGRSVGWFGMALVDVLEILDQNIEVKRLLGELLKEMIDGMLVFQHKSGLWYQVIDRGDYQGNYLETSVSTMMAYTVLKAVRHSYLEKDYLHYGLKAFFGVIGTYLKTKEKKMSLNGTCKVAGLDHIKRDGTIEYYLSEPIAADEAKGVAPFIMAYSEILRLEQYCSNIPKDLKDNDDDTIYR